MPIHVTKLLMYDVFKYEKHSIAVSNEETDTFCRL